jgi:hypothetical protein
MPVNTSVFASGENFACCAAHAGSVIAVGSPPFVESQIW